MKMNTKTVLGPLEYKYGGHIDLSMVLTETERGEYGLSSVYMGRLPEKEFELPQELMSR